MVGVTRDRGLGVTRDFVGEGRHEGEVLKLPGALPELGMEVWRWVGVDK